MTTPVKFYDSDLYKDFLSVYEVHYDYRIFFFFFFCWAEDDDNNVFLYFSEFLEGITNILCE